MRLVDVGGSAAAAPVRRVAMLSLHTSPTDPPGVGDAGGMNVYVLELSRRLAEHGVEVDVYTRATSTLTPPVVEVAPGVTVRAVTAGPLADVPKPDLPAQVGPFVGAALRTQEDLTLGPYDLVHSHYWLSGQAGAMVAHRWGVPLVHSMHTMAKVKNGSLAAGDTPEPAVRVVGEQAVVAVSDLLVASTEDEARQLVQRYDAAAERVGVVHPGVDPDVFGVGRTGGRAVARDRLGVPDGAHLLVFAGRLQPLKGADVLVRAVAALLGRRPELREGLLLAVVGGPSGRGDDHLRTLQRLTAELGLDDVVAFVPPTGQDRLADWYAAATLVCVPSYSESFGLVALEAQAAGTPVVAARVGGLPVAVRDGVSGVLVDGHDPDGWARALQRLLERPRLLDAMGAAAVRHAAGFSWDRTAEQTAAVYRDAVRAAVRAAVLPTAVLPTADPAALARTS